MNDIHLTISVFWKIFQYLIGGLGLILIILFLIGSYVSIKKWCHDRVYDAIQIYKFIIRKTK